MKRATSFKKVVLCHTNDFKAPLNEKIKTWVETNGGIFEKELTAQVTHLVASTRAWKRLHPIVKQARRMRSIWIVKYDWLEDSLMKKPVKALPVDKYLYEQTKLKRAKVSKRRLTFSASGSNDPGEISIPREKRIDTTGAEFDKARLEFEQDMGKVGFHPYYDKTGFVYIVTLLRYDILKSRFEKYRLKVGFDPPTLPYEIVPGLHTELYLFPRPEPFSSAPVVEFEILNTFQNASCIYLAEPWAQCIQLYESNDEPHTYACYTQYSRPGTSKQLLTLAPPGSTWAFAWSMFQKYFKQKVGTAWNERVEVGSEIKIDVENNDDKFQYQAPRIGEPEGLREAIALHQGPISRQDQDVEKKQTTVEDEDIEIEEQNDICIQSEGCNETEDEEAELDDTHLP